MNVVEGVLLWAAVAVYVAALLGSLSGPLLRWPRVEEVSQRWWPVALALHLGSALVRWIETGHGPVMYAYENSLAGSFAVAVIFFLASRRLPAVRRALPLVLVVTLLILGNGLTSPSTPAPLEPPFRSGWLVVHVTFAWVGFSSFVVAAVLSVIFLVTHRKREAAGEQAKSALLDDVAGRLIALGFAGHFVMLASGAIWAHGLWGRYWAWDPVETWSLISWVIYGLNLHLRFSMGWRGSKAAWLTVASVVAIVVTFFGIGVISDVHTELL